VIPSADSTGSATSDTDRQQFPLPAATTISGC